MSRTKLILLVFVSLSAVIKWTNAAFLVSRNPNNIKFLLFKDNQNPDSFTEIPYGNETSYTACGYNPEKGLILLIHDVLSNSKTASDVQLIKNAYLTGRTNSNIVMVDYGKLTTANAGDFNPLSPFSFSTLTWVAGRFNANIVAKRVAEFIFLGMRAKVIKRPEDVHIVGFGLGAHIAGATGQQVIRIRSRPIRRITGLDPSKQFPIRLTSRLDESDALFVDVTYTSMIADIGRRGGHVQFYLNGGGPHQPNCPNFFPFTETYCSHTTAVHYFAKSITRRKIPACKCVRCRRSRYQPKECDGTDLTEYGHYVPEGVRGDFFVRLA